MISPILHNLPTEDSIFIDREQQIDEVMNTLSFSRFWMIALWGMGGVGKTSLALRVARLCLLERRFEAIVWSTAKSYELGARGFRKTIEKRQDRVVLTLNDLLNTICRVFGETSAINMSIQQKSDRVIQLLTDHKTLLIIDNLDMIPDRPAAEIIQFIRYSVPNPSQTLLTSRYQLSGKGEYAIELMGLDRYYSIEFMRSVAALVGYDAIAFADLQTLEAIHQVTGGIPLAMKWLIGRARRSQKDIYAILNDMVRSESDILEYCFKQSYWSVSKEARILLQALSPADQALDSHQINTVSGLGDYQIIEAVDDLIPMSLLDQDKLGRFKLHPLTKAFARGELARDPLFESQVLQRYASL